jgi:hypothetical protein
MSVGHPGIELLAREALDPAFVVGFNAQDRMVPSAIGGHAVAERQSEPGGDDTSPVGKVAQISTPQVGMASCSRCQARWGGLRTAHCDACHETFTVVAAFDKHRAGSNTDRGRHCLDPHAAGLVDAKRADPCWGFRGPGEDGVGPLMNKMAAAAARTPGFLK